VPAVVVVVVAAAAAGKCSGSLDCPLSTIIDCGTCDGFVGRKSTRKTRANERAAIVFQIPDGKMGRQP
jgi:hypothetical protein